MFGQNNLKHMDCIFCKIAGKQIPNYTVYEDKNALAFLDIHPCALGHTVVVPKKHYERLEDMPADELALLIGAVQKAVKKLSEKLKPAGFNVGLNNGPEAGQAVPHLHWHILPRYSGDGGGSMHSIVRNPGDKKAEEVFKML